jgi:hypothetical protein
VRGILAISALVLLALGGAPAEAYYRGPGAYYRSVDGRLVHRPYHTSRHMRGEMAVCRDGTHSVSHHHQGTCSHHGGVGHWG